jgi:hypothetical protein
MGHILRINKLQEIIKDSSPFLLEDDDPVGHTIGLAPSFPLNPQFRFWIGALLVPFARAVRDHEFLQRSSAGSRLLLFRCDGTDVRLRVSVI